MTEDVSLQERFLQTRGKPISIGGEIIVQRDLIALSDISLVNIRFLGDQAFLDNGIVLSVVPPGSIRLSDGTSVNAVKIWDEEGLPRIVEHVVDPRGQVLKVHNKYKVKHPNGEVTEENFTGNAGMVVTEVGVTKRRYECSSGPGPFSKNDLVLEISWA